MTSPLFSPAIADQIETELDEYFARAIHLAEKQSQSYQYIWKSLRDVVKAGGKRFRPNMTMLAYELFGGSNPGGVIPAATAQELLHVSLLIHDDIIDRDYIRHGVPNIAGRYKAHYQKYVSNTDDLTHYAHSAAILAGDLLLAGAFELTMCNDLTPEQKSAAHQLLSEAVVTVAGGELMDTEGSFVPYTKGDALKVAFFKTAHYSFVTPLITGATLAGADAEQINSLRNYGEALGIAFQLVDDLLSVFGSEAQTGKSTLGDIREGKRTFMAECALATMTTNDKLLLNQAFGNQHATTEAIIEAKELLISSGAKQQTEAAITEYCNAARDAIDRMGLDPSGQEKLAQLIDLATERTS